ncbi:GPP34 family phosphoprotein [Amycolatopsis sp. 195334CR]|uniref:GOLPH3/VPS74 family protein n=1 Tax=Amycolatopsis sp. 195334CR TaxID=2814588 RepID=UPI001A8F7E49|nr:GPP34 family phosphoprotein [Amycolatopsis sp. 195334CR]MBN6038422.1 GPP34 family phosphoprotein [Amycolatopsis sp. 195334CR]
MPELTVAEEVVLIALDDQTGGGKARLGLDWAVAGAAIVELALTQRIAVAEDDLVTVLDPAPTGVGHLDAVLTGADGVKVPKLLRRTRHGAPGRTIAALVERGVLQQKRTWLLGVLPAHRYPAGEGAAEAEVRARLTGTVLNGRTPDERTAALIGVLHAAKLWRRAVPTGERKQVRRRMAEIAKGQSVSPAVRKAIVRTQAAIAAMAAASSSG